MNMVAMQKAGGEGGSTVHSGAVRKVPLSSGTQKEARGNASRLLKESSRRGNSQGKGPEEEDT